MSLVKVKGKINAEGLLTARLPQPAAQGDVDVFVDLPVRTNVPEDERSPNAQGEDNSLEARRERIRSLFGILADEPFERPDQGEFEERPPL
jgi:hypothetical protein